MQPSSDPEGRGGGGLVAEVGFIPGGIDSASGFVMLTSGRGECCVVCVSPPVGDIVARSVWYVVHMWVYRYAYIIDMQKHARLRGGCLGVSTRLECVAFVARLRS